MVKLVGKHALIDMKCASNSTLGTDFDEGDGKEAAARMQVICRCAHKILLSYVEKDVNVMVCSENIALPADLFAPRLETSQSLINDDTSEDESLEPLRKRKSTPKSRSKKTSPRKPKACSNPAPAQDDEMERLFFFETSPLSAGDVSGISLSGLGDESNTRDVGDSQARFNDDGNQHKSENSSDVRGGAQTDEEEYEMGGGEVLFDDDWIITAQTMPTSPLLPINHTNVPLNRASSSKRTIRVVVRVQPLQTEETAEQSRECVIAKGKEIFMQGRSKPFEFDSVFPSSASQEDVYKETVGTSISDHVYNGFNVTLLAYGSTGSGKLFKNIALYIFLLGIDLALLHNLEGKTFTMGTRTNGRNTNCTYIITPKDGIAPRAVHDLFSYRESLPSGPECVKITLSCLQIYNEQAIDLLADDHDSSIELPVYDAPDRKRVVIPNLKNFDVTSSQEVHLLMERAWQNRATQQTKLNNVSSRSHVICTFNVTVLPSKAQNAEGVKAKLTLVDLAGSESLGRTGATGTQRAEGVNINQGISALGRVILALEQRNKNPDVHIPYRDSMLTRILKNSLGGNSRTTMIACISSSTPNASETESTLRYAEMTRNITNSVKKNAVTTVAKIPKRSDERLNSESEMIRNDVIAQLRNEVMKLKTENFALKKEAFEATLRANKWEAKFKQIAEDSNLQGIDLAVDTTSSTVTKRQAISGSTGRMELDAFTGNARKRQFTDEDNVSFELFGIDCQSDTSDLSRIEQTPESRRINNDAITSNNPGMRSRGRDSDTEPEQGTLSTGPRMQHRKVIANHYDRRCIELQEKAEARGDDAKEYKFKCMRKDEDGETCGGLRSCLLTTQAKCPKCRKKACPYTDYWAMADQTEKPKPTEHLVCCSVNPANHFVGYHSRSQNCCGSTHKIGGGHFLPNDEQIQIHPSKNNTAWSEEVSFQCHSL
jgi:hypothetical protein